MYKNISGLCFSPTNNTKNLLSEISKELSEKLDIRNLNVYDFTLVKERTKLKKFTLNDIVIIAIPVYAGRVPNLLLDYLSSIKGGGALGIPLVTFGNRDFDDALIELAQIMDKSGFNIISAAAFVYPHSFSNILAENRPDEKDKKLLRSLTRESVKKIEKINAALSNLDKEMTKNSYLAKNSYKDMLCQNLLDLSSIKGLVPYRDYFKPLDKNGNIFEFRKIKPQTNDTCTKCSICAKLCPMGAIEESNPKIISGKCIKCCACIKSCPLNAKEFLDENFLKHKLELEELCSTRQESYIFY